MTPEFTRASDPGAGAIFSALTVEGAAYLALSTAAFLLRFIALDGVPLNSAEAQQALAAFNSSQGLASTFTGSPLLFTANTLVFALFTASDLTARLLPALAGTALVLLPILFRRYLGRTGALVASALLAFSPSLVLFSRTLDGVVPAVAVSLAAIGYGGSWLESRRARDLYLTAGCAALALLAAPDVWTIALAVLIFFVATRFEFAVESRESNSDESDRQEANVENVKFKALLVFAIVFGSVSTTFLIHKEGIGAAFDLLAGWLDSLRPGVSFLDVFRLLVVYEPVAIFFGIGFGLDLILGAREKKWSELHSLLAIWIVTALLLLSFSADNNPARIVILVVPLVLMAGAGIGRWLERSVEQARALGRVELLSHEAPILAVSVSLLAFLSIVVAGSVQHGNIAVADLFARIFGTSQDNPGLTNSLILLLFLFSFLMAAVLAVTTLGQTRALRLGTLLALVVLSLWTFRQTMMLNFSDGGALNPREWLVVRAASPNVRDLTSDLESQSRWRANDTHSLVIVVDESLGPIVRWSLRDFRYAVFSSRPVPTPDTQALVTPSEGPPPPGSWIEQKYQVELARGNDAGSALRALIYRDAGSVQATSVSLWIQRP